MAARHQNPLHCLSPNTAGSNFPGTFLAIHQISKCYIEVLSIFFNLATMLGAAAETETFIWAGLMVHEVGANMVRQNTFSGLSFVLGKSSEDSRSCLSLSCPQMGCRWQFGA
jgi:hypothetical protein